LPFYNKSLPIAETFEMAEVREKEGLPYVAVILLSKQDFLIAQITFERRFLAFLS
jgi:hypothetical protein